MIVDSYRTAAPASALDYISSGLAVVDPYQTFATWWADGVAGVDPPSPGVTQEPAGYVYKTLDAALLDVFYTGNPGRRRILVRPTATYVPGGAITVNRGSYFPAGGPDAAHPCVLQGDPSTTTFPVISDQLGGCSVIIGASLGATTTFTINDPIVGPSRQPFAVGEMVSWYNIGDVSFGPITGITPGGTTVITVANTLAVNDTVQFYGIGGMTQLNGLTTQVLAASSTQVTVNISSGSFSTWTSGGNVVKNSFTSTSLNGSTGGGSGTVTAVSGTGPPWTVTVNLNSTGFNPWVTGGNIWRGVVMLGVGNAGGFGTSAQNVNHIVIRKLNMANAISGCIYTNGFGTYFPTDITIEYCNFHGNRYPYTNPGGTGGWLQELHGTGTTFVTLRYCKFSDMGPRPDVPLSQYNTMSLNCVPMETYGADNVTVQNCLFVGAYAGMTMKTYQAGGNPSGDATQNNWTVVNNIFANCYNCITLGTSAFTNYKPSNNWVVTGNLVYGPTLAVSGDNSASFIGVRGSAEPTLAQGSNILVANNTIAEDVVSALHWAAATGVVFRDNISLVNANTPWHIRTNSGIGSSDYSSKDNVVFSQLDYNVYGNSTTWQLDWLSTPYQVNYSYPSFAAWQAAYTSPQGSGAPTAPADLATTGNPDQHGVWIPNLSAPYNTVAGNFPNMGSRNYTIAPGSPLLTASSTGGRVGYDPTNIGPGW